MFSRCTNVSTLNITEVYVEDATFNFVVYNVMLPIVVAVGVVGNVLNIITLRSRKLQTVPFKFIRAIAVFDLVALVLVAFACFRIARILPKQYAWLVWYQSRMELPLMNTFLISGVVVALALTVERYVMVCHPHNQHRLPPSKRARIYIAFSVFLSAIIHIPMTVENYVCEEMDPITGDVAYQRTGHDFTGWRDTLYKWYGIGREFVRVTAVVVLAVLNVVIVRALEERKQRRAQMTIKSSTKSRRPNRRSSLFCSFEERRLTTMMIGMMIVYLVGNLPQAVLMVMMEGSFNTENDLWYHYYRGIANLLEISNHCLSFYIFCISSKDYSETFRETCLKPCGLCSYPWCPSALRKFSVDSAELFALRDDVNFGRNSNLIDVETPTLSQGERNGDLVYL